MNDKVLFTGYLAQPPQSVSRTNYTIYAGFQIIQTQPILFEIIFQIINVIHTI